MTDNNNDIPDLSISEINQLFSDIIESPPHTRVESQWIL